MREHLGALEVLIVHRSRYDDWSLPKGKLDRGESHEEAALREVEEETGLRCELGRERTDVRYRDRKGRRKRVRYWKMRPLAGSFRVNDEVDEVRWVRVPDLHGALTYPRDAVVVKRIVA